MEERLAGGANSGAVRVDGTVRRATGATTPAVHALLRHLESVGFDGAPRVLGVDGRGREVLTYLEGETIGAERPWPAWARSGAALAAAGRWLRAYHDAVRPFVPPPGSRWFGDHDDLRPGELIGHHDAGPYNAVWRDGALAGFIDWDLAGPMPAVRDLASVAISWVPLLPDARAALDGFDAPLDRAGRLRALLEAYGWDGGLPRCSTRSSAAPTSTPPGCARPPTRATDRRRRW